MNAISWAARDHGFLGGTQTISKQSEERQLLTPDIIFPFENRALYQRQQNMVEPSGAFLVFEGGVGTLYEFYQILTMEKIDKLNRQIIIVGERDLYEDTKKELEKGVKKGHIPRYVPDLVSYIEKGSDLYKKLIEHYGLEG